LVNYAVVLHFLIVILIYIANCELYVNLHVHSVIWLQVMVRSHTCLMESLFLRLDLNASGRYLCCNFDKSWFLDSCIVHRVEKRVCSYPRMALTNLNMYLSTIVMKDSLPLPDRVKLNIVLPAGEHDGKNW